MCTQRPWMHDKSRTLGAFLLEERVEKPTRGLAGARAAAPGNPVRQENATTSYPAPRTQGSTHISRHLAVDLLLKLTPFSPPVGEHSTGRHHFWGLFLSEATVEGMKDTRDFDPAKLFRPEAPDVAVFIKEEKIPNTVSVQ